MNKLFDDKERTETGPGKYAMDPFEFIDKSATPEVNTVREILNSWFNNYPVDEQNDLKKRFPSHLYSTFYELFLHELFFRQGFNIKIHPTLPGTNRKPDFLISKDGFEIYVEAKDSQDKSEIDIGLEKIENEIYDSLNTIDSPDFFFMKKKLVLKSTKYPSIKALKAHLQSEIRNHDADVVDQEKEVKGLPHVFYSDENIEFEALLIPKIKRARGKQGVRPYGGGMGNVRIGGADESIYSALKSKAGRYGHLDKPYLICVNSANNFGANEHSVKSALFGSLTVTFSNNPKNKDERLEHANDGFFFGPRGPQFTRVSAVLITDADMGNLTTTKHWLVKHPFAKSPLDFSVFDLSYIHVEGNKIETTVKKGIQEILFE